MPRKSRVLEQVFDASTSQTAFGAVLQVLASQSIKPPTTGSSVKSESCVSAATIRSQPARKVCGLAGECAATGSGRGKEQDELVKESRDGRRPSIHFAAALRRPAAENDNKAQAIGPRKGAMIDTPE